MRRVVDTIDNMRTFINVARQQSFTAGAKQLGISTKLASKYVRHLEERLGAQLFYRTTRSVRLTETGSAYYDRCVSLLDQLDELENLVQERQSTLAGSIRITASTGFGSHELVDAILPFQLAHPDVSIDLHLSDQNISIVDQGFDLAIRFGALENSSLIARKLMNMRIVVFASPDYLKQYGEPTDPEGLSSHNCLVRGNSIDYKQWHFTIEGKKVSFPVSGSFSVNSPRAIAKMAVAGLGIGMGPMYIVKELAESGELKLLFEDQESTEIGLYAVYPPNRHLTARIRALIDHLVLMFS